MSKARCLCLLLDHMCGLLQCHTELREPLLRVGGGCGSDGISSRLRRPAGISNGWWGVWRQRPTAAMPVHQVCDCLLSHGIVVALREPQGSNEGAAGGSLPWGGRCHGDFDMGWCAHNPSCFSTHRCWDSPWILVTPVFCGRGLLLAAFRNICHTGKSCFDYRYHSSARQSDECLARCVRTSSS